MGIRKKIADAAERVVLGDVKDKAKSVSDALKKAADDRKPGER